jgi:hypothetical protein
MAARTRGSCHSVRPMETDLLGPTNFQASNHNEQVRTTTSMSSGRAATTPRKPSNWPLTFSGFPGSDLSCGRPDCVAEVVGLELGNVGANYPFERSHRFAGIRPNSGLGDYSRLSCDVSAECQMLTQAAVNR